MVRAQTGRDAEGVVVAVVVVGRKKLTRKQRRKRMRGTRWQDAGDTMAVALRHGLIRTIRTKHY